MPNARFNGASSAYLGFWKIWIMYYSLMSPSSLSFLHLEELLVWRSPKEAYHLACCMPRLKHGGGSVIGWAAGRLLVLDGHTTAKDHWTILEDHVHPVVQILYAEGGAVYQDDVPKHTGEWFDEHESEVEHHMLPAVTRFKYYQATLGCFGEAIQETFFSTSIT